MPPRQPRLQRRHLCDHPGHARSIHELRAHLCRCQPRCDRSGAHRHGRCAEQGLRRRQPDADLCEFGLVNGDTLSGLLATTATTASNVGAYAITQGTLAASTNYALTYVGANLTVTAGAPLPVPADNIIASAQSAAFPSYFISNDFPGNGGNDTRGEDSFASADFAAGPYASACTPAGILRSLIDTVASI